MNFSDLLCVVFGFRVRTSQKCIFLFFVCSLFCFPLVFFLLLRGLSSWIQPQKHPFSVGVSELGRGVLTRGAIQLRG